LLGLHPQSERPFEILSSAIPGLKDEDLVDEDRSSLDGEADSAMQDLSEHVHTEEHSSLEDAGLLDDDNSMLARRLRG